MALKDLCYLDGLLTDPSRISEYIDVSMHRKLNFAACSDISLEIHFEWSNDGVRKCLTTCFKISPQLWRAEEIKIIMPYLRVHIINNVKLSNNELFFGIYKFGAAQEKPIVQEIQQVESAPIPIIKPEKRVWFKKSVAQKNSARDERLPEYLPVNSILITDRKGGVAVLPAGQPGEVLCVNEAGGITWCRQEFLAPLNCKNELPE
jgi:hypothetical protein